MIDKDKIENYKKYTIQELMNIALYETDIEEELLIFSKKMQKDEIPIELELYNISIDYDGKSELQKLKIYFNLQYFFPKNKIRIDKTIHGYHFIVAGVTPKKFGVEKSIVLREVIGDDQWRIVCSIRRGGDALYFTSQIKWKFSNSKVKVKKEYQYESLDELNLLCSPFLRVHSISRKH